MDTLWVQIALALEARLNESAVTDVYGTVHTRPTGLVVELDRKKPVRPIHLVNGPIIDISPDSSPNVDLVTPGAKHLARAVNRTFKFNISNFALSGDDSGLVASDPGYIWIVVALMSDIRLGGLAHLIEEGPQDYFESEHSDSAETMAGRETIFLVHTHTTVADPTRRQ